MLENNLNNDIPTLDIQQLEKVLLAEGVPISDLYRGAHKYFHINRFEEFHKIAKFPLKSDAQPRRINVYSFFFLTKGKSARSNGLDTYEFGENTFYFIPAYQITIFKAAFKDVEGYYCYFNLEVLTHDTSPNLVLKEFPFLEFNCFPLVKINQKSSVNVINVLERLVQEYHVEGESQKDILSVYLRALFTELKPFVETSKPVITNAANNITELYKKALANYVVDKNKISDYAELLNITPNHLNKCIKKTTNKSARELLEEMLLLEAKVLLKQTNLSISEVGYKIGRSEVSDFARFFKNKTGLRPSEYRMLKV